MSVSATLYIVSKDPSLGVVNADLLASILKTLNQNSLNDCKADRISGLRSVESWEVEFKYPASKKVMSASIYFHKSDIADLAEGKNIGTVSIDRSSISDKTYINPFRDLVTNLMENYEIHWQDSDHGDDAVLVTPEWLKRRFKIKI